MIIWHNERGHLSGDTKKNASTEHLLGDMVGSFAPTVSGGVRGIFGRPLKRPFRTLRSAF